VPKETRSVKMIADKILALIKEEIKTDPEKRGYAGKTDAEIMVLLNSPYDQEVITTSHVGKQSPLNRILSGISGVGNLIDAKDVKDAKQLIL
jgi:hypothetical protein